MKFVSQIGDIADCGCPKCDCDSMCDYYNCKSMYFFAKVSKVTSRFYGIITICVTIITIWVTMVNVAMIPKYYYSDMGLFHESIGKLFVSWCYAISIFIFEFFKYFPIKVAVVFTKLFNGDIIFYSLFDFQNLYDFDVFKYTVLIAKLLFS